MKKINYKGVWINSFGIPTIKSKLGECDKKVDYVKRVYNTSFSSDFGENSPKNLIVIYDIPEEKKKERD
ncbi:MAG: hypothetical protein ABIF22_01200 [bacterium]